MSFNDTSLLLNDELFPHGAGAAGRLEVRFEVKSAEEAAVSPSHFPQTTGP